MHGLMSDPGEPLFCVATPLSGGLISNTLERGSISFSTILVSLSVSLIISFDIWSG